MIEFLLSVKIFQLVKKVLLKRRQFDRYTSIKKLTKCIIIPGYCKLLNFFEMDFRIGYAESGGMVVV
jgi:hypothetical protein